MTALVAVELIVGLVILTTLTIVNYKLMKKMEKEEWSDLREAENEYILRNYTIGCGPVLF